MGFWAVKACQGILGTVVTLRTLKAGGTVSNGRPPATALNKKPKRTWSTARSPFSPLLSLLLVAMLASSLGSGCDRGPMVGDDLEEAKTASQHHNWTLAERLLERYLRIQQDPDKRWEAWQRLLEVTTSASTDYRTGLDYLEAMLQEFYEDESRTKIILQRMGELNETLRRYSRAADVWSTYIELGDLTDDEAVQGHRRLAQIHFRERQFDAGEDVLQSCLALGVADKGRALCVYDLADMNMARERWKDATDLALQVMDMDVEEKVKGITAFLLGDALEQQKNFAEALQYFEAAQGYYPNQLVVDNRIAYLKQKLKK